MSARLRKLMADNPTLDRLWDELNDPRNRPTPQVTIEAILHCVRERGLPWRCMSHRTSSGCAAAMRQRRSRSTDA